MISALRLVFSRPKLLRTFALLLLILGPLGSAPLRAYVDAAFAAQLQLIDASLRAQGATPATATAAQWRQAFTSVEEVLGQRGALRLKFFLAYVLITPAQTRAFITAVSAMRNDEVRVYGKTDFLGPRVNFADVFPWFGKFEAAGATKELKGAFTGIGLNFPGISTNRFVTGISYDADLAYGYYEQPGAVTSQPFTFNPREPAPFVIVLPLLTGDTGATVAGGSSTGNILVGDAFRGTGGNQTTTTNVWMKEMSGSYSVRNIGGYTGSTRTRAAGVSGDGTTIVGGYQDAQFRTRAYRWSQGGGYFDLGVLPGQTSSQATAASQDGARIVGTSGTGAFTWTQAGGMTALPNLPMLTRTQALCIAPDEMFIGGLGQDASFRETAQLWAKIEGTYTTYDLGKILAGSGANLTGWTMNRITAIVKNADTSYNIAGDATLNGVPQGFVFQLTAGGGGPPPTIATQPRAQAVGLGGTVVFSVTATNATTYQWRRDGVTIPGATNATYTLPNAQSAATGNYTCLVGNAEGAVVSAVAPLTVANTVSRLNNLSVRTTAGTAANPLIVGLTTAGGTKDILLRAVGPTLGQFGVGGTLADPQLALFNSSSVQTAQNDDWGGGVALQTSFTNVGAFPLGLTSKDAALLSTLQPGGYTAQVSGIGGSTGVVLLESYDSDVGSPLARYTNLSARNQVGTGGNILIVGFNLAGTGPKRLLIRAIGPGLGQFGVTGVLSDPQLAVFNAAGTEIARNDDWEDNRVVIGPAFAEVGAFPLGLGSRDAATVVSLEPGSYTVQVSGVNNGTGVALVEIYELP
jgi:probable HAF family extracellular repeat protein